MMRWITLLTAAIVLTGCVTTREVVYREPYTSDGYYAQSPSYQRQGDSYYSPAYSGHGDYYFGASYGASYFNYPVYYSVFWPINRWYYDPFAYPGYYYGVTWFPRSYGSLSLSYSNRWHGSGWLSYSPYRYSYVDNYYDWRPWYNRYPTYSNYYPTPRYGDARVEASRLADLRRPLRSQSYNNGGRIQSSSGAYPVYSGNRSTDAVRRVGAGTSRTTPETGVFGNPTRGTSSGSRIQSTPRGNSMPSTPSRVGSSRNEVERFSGQRAPLQRSPASDTSLKDRQAQDRRGYALPGNSTAPRTPDTRIPLRGTQSTLPVRDPASVAPAPTRSAPSRVGVESRPVIRDAAPVRSVTPSNEYSPARSSLPTRSAPVQTRPAPSYAPAPSSPSSPAPVLRTAPARNAPVTAPARSAPAAAPAPRSAPVESRSESSSSSSRAGSSNVRRTGSRDR